MILKTKFLSLYGSPIIMGCSLIGQLLAILVKQNRTEHTCKIWREAKLVGLVIAKDSSIIGSIIQ
jgi:hypothetical protein